MPRKAQSKKPNKKETRPKKGDTAKIRPQTTTKKPKTTKKKPSMNTRKKTTKKTALSYNRDEYNSILTYLSEDQNNSSIKRIERAFTQTLFLLNQSVSDDNIEFAVLGFSRKVYHININDNITCNCIDYKIRKAVCKHQIFVLAKVLRSTHSIDTLKRILEEKRANINLVKLLDGARKLAGSIKGDDETVRSYKAIYCVSGAADVVQRREYIGEKCSICFDGMNEKHKVTWCKHCCGSSFHSDCIDMWFSAKSDTSKRCPLCRNIWTGIETEGILSKNRLATL